MTDDRKQLATYLLLTIAFSSVFYFLIIKSGHLGAGGGSYVLSLMWCPGAAAMLTKKLYGQPLATLGWKWGEPRYQVLSYLIPLAYATVAYVTVWISGLGSFYDHDFVDFLSKRFELGALRPWMTIALYFAFMATAGVIRSCSSALGEEIGWRGFLVPQLSRVTGSFTATALISGVIWSLWHYPILIFADYNSGTPIWYGLGCFTVMVISSCFIYAWMRLKSGSLWTGVLLHGSHNLFIQSFFDPLTKNTGRTAWYTTEFGAALALVSLVFGIYFWTRRKEVEGAAVGG